MHRHLIVARDGVEGWFARKRRSGSAGREAVRTESKGKTPIAVAGLGRCRGGCERKRLSGWLNRGWRWGRGSGGGDGDLRGEISRGGTREEDWMALLCVAVAKFVYLLLVPGISRGYPRVGFCRGAGERCGLFRLSIRWRFSWIAVLG